jgi:hypothetical protein
MQESNKLPIKLKSNNLLDLSSIQLALDREEMILNGLDNVD